MKSRKVERNEEGIDGGIGYWSQNTQSRGQTVNLSESFEIESLSILRGCPGIMYIDEIGRPNARPRRSTRGFAPFMYCYRRYDKTIARNCSSPLASTTDKWTVGHAKWQIETFQIPEARETKLHIGQKGLEGISGSMMRYSSVDHSKLLGQTWNYGEIQLSWDMSCHFMHTLFLRQFCLARKLARQIDAMFRKEDRSLYFYTEIIYNTL